MTKFLGSNFYKGSIFSILLLSATALSSCQKGNTTDKITKDDVRASNNTSNISNNTTYPDVIDLFACKPAENAFVAAHRGTHIGSKFPENSLISLQALVKNNVSFAEIDVAQLTDGKLITFHDGTWERRSVGPNEVLSLPVAATTWEQSQKLLLKDTNDAITATRPSSFADILTYAKDKIYLEIDFKSSASEADVISKIKSAGMLHQVILISYTTEQAQRLHNLAPTAAISVGIFKPNDIKDLEAQGIPINVMTAWTGEGPLTLELANALRQHNIPILAASFFSIDNQVKQSGNTYIYTEFAKLPDLIVTDSAFQTQQVLEIKGNNLQNMKTCLAQQ